MTQTIVGTATEESTRNGEREIAPERRGTECPECDGSVHRDEEHGERTCTECGLVLDADAIDYGPEWRTLDDDADERRRVGAPVSKLRHDKGLSTTIGWRDEDAYGNRISGRKREQLQRLRTWNERFTSKDAAERNLKQAFGEIERMASALGLPEPCRETAGVLYRRAVDEGLLPGRSIEAMSTASLYAAARRHGTPRTLVAFTSVSRVDKLPIQRAYRYLSSELGLQIEPADPIHYLPQYASVLEISDDAERLAREILEAAKAQGLHSGRSPAGLAAAAIYGAARLANERLTQERIGEETGVSRVTVRNRYRELLDAYGEERER
ncbi:transcription initiation factor IIB [Natrinema versiforme]|uniref:Transcription initiation factor IIB n=1 Tax=Natrinema versiforme JCM 10478 TaxID=1227496 RepID=L9XQ35_9EURY|nr:TFIIB-type zinc ribbon-containing protein [Natrinema versiforme]ELY63924.1 Transcription factor TFIIB cyclin-related protein [Natrinema versiforme JCM 10478]